MFCLSIYLSVCPFKTLDEIFDNSRLWDKIELIRFSGEIVIWSWIQIFISVHLFVICKAVLLVCYLPVVSTVMLMAVGTSLVSVLQCNLNCRIERLWQRFKLHFECFLVFSVQSAESV